MARAFALLSCLLALALAPDARGADGVDPTTLRGKVLCGYQGWFRCPGDGTGRGWVHWSRDGRRIAPETLTFEMWPDLSDFAADERFPAPGFTLPDGQPAALFSSADPRTVNRHFDWMRDHGIDGAFVQRFVVDLRNPAEAARVLNHARAAANRTGRVFAVDYDLSGAPNATVLDRLAADWKRLVDDSKITSDPRYLRHDGRPVVAVFGFFEERMNAALANKLIDVFKSDGPYRAFVIGGVPWYWRRTKDTEWARVYRRFDGLKPWNVGNTTTRDGRRYATTSYWADDLAEARRAGMFYLPVIYPGFGWDNLQRTPPGRSTIPRLGGAFFWDQFLAARRLGLDSAFVAMFDEVDEGTAVFKVTNSPPKEAHFLTYDGLPPDWYLRLTGEGARLLRGERPPTDELPLRPPGAGER